jgi:hypothetical protein
VWPGVIGMLVRNAQAKLFSEIFLSLINGSSQKAQYVFAISELYDF